MPEKGRQPHRAAERALATLAALATLSCGDTVLQIDPADVVELRVSADSALVFVSRTVQIRAYPLDAAGTLLVGQVVDWTSANASVATVDGEGLVTGVAPGSVDIVAAMGAHRDTTFVTVTPLPVLTLLADSIGFTATAGGASPAPDSVQITNSGGGSLVVAVDSIVYGTGATGWLAAQLGGSVAPTPLRLTVTSSAVTTAGTYLGTVWVSGGDAGGSPATIIVTLRINPGLPASMTVNDGNGQSRTAGLAVSVAPSVLVRDTHGNAAVGASVAFAVTGGGGQVTGTPATAGPTGVARVGSWTLGQTAGPNQLTATLGSLTPVVFAATGTAGSATQVVVTAGDNQSAVAGSAVATPPAVSVRDQFGNGVTGVGVTFAVTSGGGGITGASQTSGTGGVATLGSWTLGAAAGTNTLSAAATGVGSPAVITATGLTGAADSMYIQAGNAQSDTVAATLPVAYSVRVVDSNGNGVQGIPVSWQATGGVGSFVNVTSTDVNGFSTAVRVLGTTPGTHLATAAVGGLPGSPVPFSANATVGSPAAITVTAGAAQTDTVNQVVPTAPQVRVADKFDNPIQGNPVTFQVTGGGGSVSPTTPIATLANGTATATSWQLGTVAGASRDTLMATATGAGITGNPVRIVASSVAGPPTSIAIVQGGAPQQTAITGNAVAVAPTVVVRDQFTNPVPNATVSFSASGSGSVGSPSPSTDSNGQASTTWFVSAGGHAMGTTGTFQNTLTATVQGTAVSTAFTGFAIYSWGAHVNPLWASSGCTGCHGTPTGSSSLPLANAADVNYDALFNINPFCDATLVGAGWRRVNPSGGDTGHDFSVLRLLMETTVSTEGACGPHGFAKLSAANLDIVRAWIRNGAPEN